MNSEQQPKWPSFRSLVVLQTQNSFNDKAAQFLLIPLGNWVAGKYINMEWASRTEHLLAFLLLLPSILFAPLSGWFSDHFSKQRIILSATLMQTGILALFGFSFSQENYPLTIFCFFLLALQSTLLGPAKLGILKELLGPSHLGYANGLMQMTSILAMLGGQIAYGWWFSHRLETNPTDNGWDAALLPLFVLFFISLLPITLTFFISHTKPHQTSTLQLRLFWRHFEHLGNIWRERPLRLSCLGIAWFWAFAGLLQLICIQIAKKMSEGNDNGFGTSLSGFMAAAGLGIAFGSVLSSRWSRQRIELGLIPIAGLGMTLSCAFLALTPTNSIFLYLGLFLGGVSSAGFLVPLQAYVQDVADPKHRGRILSANNLLNCLGGILAVGFQLLLTELAFPSRVQFAIVGILSLFATIYVTGLLPKSLITLLVRAILSLRYQIRLHEAQNLPKTGGVLLLPNHLSFLDFLLIAVTCPRPPRVLMAKNLYHLKWLNPIARLFGALPISPEHSKDTLRTAAQALKEGEVLCIFPEGQLSRTGGLSKINRGYELMARKAKCPILPIHLHGLWGSYFAYTKGAYFSARKHFPLPRRRISIRYAPPQPDASKLPPESLLSTYQDLSQQTLQEISAKRTPLTKTEQLLTPEPKNWDEALLHLQKLPHEQRQQLTIEARRLASTNLLQAGERYLTPWDPESPFCLVITLLLPALTKAKPAIFPLNASTAKILQIAKIYQVNTLLINSLPSHLKLLPLLKHLRIHHFQTLEKKLQNIQNPSYFPGLYEEGSFYSYSIPHPQENAPRALFQPGYKKDSAGKLFPGIPPKTLQNHGWHIDSESFLFLQNEED